MDRVTKTMSGANNARAPHANRVVDSRAEVLSVCPTAFLPDEEPPDTHRKPNKNQPDKDYLGN